MLSDKCVFERPTFGQTLVLFYRQNKVVRPQEDLLIKYVKLTALLKLVNPESLLNILACDSWVIVVFETLSSVVLLCHRLYYFH